MSTTLDVKNSIETSVMAALTLTIGVNGTTEEVSALRFPDKEANLKEGMNIRNIASTELEAMTTIGFLVFNTSLTFLHKIDLEGFTK